MQRQFDRTLNILKLLVIANDFAEFFEVNDTSTFYEQSRGPDSVTLHDIEGHLVRTSATRSKKFDAPPGCDFPQPCGYFPSPDNAKNAVITNGCMSRGEIDTHLVKHHIVCATK